MLPFKLCFRLFGAGGLLNSQETDSQIIGALTVAGAR